MQGASGTAGVKVSLLSPFILSLREVGNSLMNVSFRFFQITKHVFTNYQAFRIIVSTMPDYEIFQCCFGQGAGRRNIPAHSRCQVPIVPLR